jgi:hypothetical protein
LQPPEHPNLQADAVAPPKAMHIGMQSLVHTANVCFPSAWPVIISTTEINIIATMPESLKPIFSAPKSSIFPHDILLEYLFLIEYKRMADLTA